MKKHLLSLLLLTSSLFSCKKEKQEVIQEERKTSTGLNAWNYYFPTGSPGELIKITRDGKDIYLEKRGNTYALEGDIMFTQRQVDLLMKKTSDSAARAVNADITQLWPGGVVPFTVNSGVSPYGNTLINGAIANWESSTRIRLVPRTTQTDYVEFTNSDVNNSFIGRQGGKQIINFVQTAFGSTELTHEIGHAVGLFHEQSRSDRDNFITINWSNIRTAMQNNFRTYVQEGHNGLDLETFDFNSIMLYPSLVSDLKFVYDPAIPVMTRKDGSNFTGGFFLSTGDIDAVNYLYNPPYVRAEEIVEVDDYSSDMYSYSIHREGQIRIRFFSDAARTIPYVLQHPIRLKVWHYYAYQGNAPQNSTYYVTVAQGESSVMLGRYLEITSVDYGNVLYSEREGVGVDPFIGYIK